MVVYSVCPRHIVPIVDEPLCNHAAQPDDEGAGKQGAAQASGLEQRVRVKQGTRTNQDQQQRYEEAMQGNAPRANPKARSSIPAICR